MAKKVKEKEILKKKKSHREKKQVNENKNYRMER